MNNTKQSDKKRDKIAVITTKQNTISSEILENDELTDLRGTLNIIDEHYMRSTRDYADFDDSDFYDN